MLEIDNLGPNGKYIDIDAAEPFSVYITEDNFVVVRLFDSYIKLSKNGLCSTAYIRNPHGYLPKLQVRLAPKEVVVRFRNV